MYPDQVHHAVHHREMERWGKMGKDGARWGRENGPEMEKWGKMGKDGELGGGKGGLDTCRHLPWQVLVPSMVGDGHGYCAVPSPLLATMEHLVTHKGIIRTPGTYPRHAWTPVTGCTPDCLHFPHFYPISPIFIQFPPSFPIFPVSPFFLRYIMGTSPVHHQKFCWVHLSPEKVCSAPLAPLTTQGLLRGGGSPHSPPPPPLVRPIRLNWMGSSAPQASCRPQGRATRSRP